MNPSDQVPHERVASAAVENADAESEKLRVGIDQTRAEMSKAIRALGDKLNPSDLRNAAAAELEQVETHVKAVVKEQLLEVRSILKDELHEAKLAVDDILERTREGVKQDVLAAKESVKRDVVAITESVKRDVSEAVAHVKRGVRAATIGKLETLGVRTGGIMITTKNTFIDTVRRNPLPAALAGIGLAWLFANRSRGSAAREGVEANPSGITLTLENAGRSLGQAERRVASAAHDATESAGRAVAQVGHAVSDAAGQAASATAALASDVSSKVGEITRSASETVSNLARQVPVHAARVEKSMERWFLDNPMAVGAAVLVAGAAFGATLPRTSQEDALMGASRERVIEAATDAAHQAAQAIGLLGNDVGGRSTASKSLSSSHT